MIGLMLAGILSGLLSAGLALIAGQSILLALAAYALGGILASAGMMTVMMIRMTAAGDGYPRCGERTSPTDAKHR